MDASPRKFVALVAALAGLGAAGIYASSTASAASQCSAPYVCFYENYFSGSANPLRGYTTPSGQGRSFGSDTYNYTSLPLYSSAGQSSNTSAVSNSTPYAVLAYTVTGRYVCIPRQNDFNLPSGANDYVYGYTEGPETDCSQVGTAPRLAPDGTMATPLG